MTAAFIAAVVFVAALLQSLSGFGFAIIIMPLVTLVLGLHTAAPMVALTALTVYTINVVRFRRAIDAQEPHITDIAATVLRAFGVEPPPYMEGRPIFEGPLRRQEGEETGTWKKVAV